jgi:hypothetical protein
MTLHFPEGYERGGRLVLELVERAKPKAPEFWMPPRQLALIASLGDVVDNLARNDAARALVRDILLESARRGLHEPTVMMLRVALELAGTPAKEVPWDELGIKGVLMPMRQYVAAPACASCGTPCLYACATGPTLCRACAVSRGQT